MKFNKSSSQLVNGKNNRKEINYMNTANTKGTNNKFNEEDKSMEMKSTNGTMNSIFNTKKEEERKMDGIKRTGIMTMGAIAATGMAFGVSSNTAYAADIDTNTTDAGIISEVTSSRPENVAEAKQAVDQAKANVDKADVAVEKAQGTVEKAEESVRKEEKNVESAKIDAENAFDSAKDSAAKANAEAQSNVEAAEQELDDAQSAVDQARSDVDEAEASLADAEAGVEEAKSETTSTEDNIREKEETLENAQTNLDEANQNLNNATKTKEEAKSNLEDKEATRNSAEEARANAESGLDEARKDVEVASKEADQAAEELKSAEDLRDGKLDIKDTVQYKDEQEAKEKMESAKSVADTAAEGVDLAERDLADAEASVEAAENSLDAAVDTLNKKEAALTETTNIQADAESVKENAQTTYDNAVNGASQADENVRAAENDKSKAEQAVAAAEETKEEADGKVVNAKKDVETSRQNAEAMVNSEIASARTEAAEKEATAESAQETLDAAAEKYKQGTLGFIDWMLAKEDLSKDQKQDLQFAREVLENAATEDFTKWAGGDNTGLPEERNGKVVVIGDERDATNLENLLKSIEIMKRINELRASDDNYTGELQRNDSFTNFYFMATAEAGAMRGAGLRRHSSLTTSCENLAFGYSDPNLGWYDKEKAIFDRIKGELGITKITSMEDVEKIELEASNQGVVVGHYTNLFWAADQVMGVGFTQYRTTSCYNASKASNYTSDRYNRAMHLYTIDEFEQLVQEYYQSVNKKACEEALANAKAEQIAAEEQLQTLLDGKDTAIENAIRNAKEVLATRESEAEKAGRELEDAKQMLEKAIAALENAKTVKATADQAVAEARIELEKAIEESLAADMAAAYAQKERDEAQQVVSNAEIALQDAVDGKENVKIVLAERRAALSSANDALDTATMMYNEAARKLAELTAEGTIDRLNEQKHIADAALSKAVSIKEAKEAALALAEEEVVKANQDVESARNALGSAKARLEEAIAVRDAAQEAVNTIRDELDELNEQYAPVLRAIAMRNTASAEVERTKVALSEAEGNLAKAQSDLTLAQLTKAKTEDSLLRATGLSVEAALKASVVDEEYAYLNEYIVAIRSAEANLGIARSNLEVAKTDLLEKKTESEKAQRAYIAALADLVIAQDQAGLFKMPTDYSPSRESTNNATLLKLTTENARPVLTSAEPSGRVYTATTAPVATGDENNVMALLAELLAGAGLMAVVFKMRKEEEETANQ